jgi:hypothetical protein
LCVGAQDGILTVTGNAEGTDIKKDIAVRANKACPRAPLQMAHLSALSSPFSLSPSALPRPPCKDPVSQGIHLRRSCRRPRPALLA